jgi:Protein of unknown function (DUF3810)
MQRFLRLGTIALALAAAFAPIPASWIENGYSRGPYLALQRRLTSWGNACPLAVTDVLLAGACLLVVLGARRWLAARRQVGSGRALARGIGVLATTVAGAYLVFLATWGLNYRREPLGARLDFDRGRVTAASIGDLARRVVSRVNALNAEAHATGWPDWDALPAMIGPAYRRVQRELADVDPAVPGIPKWSILTFYFERAGVSGMTDPFALEVLVDRAQLPFERPFVAAHEWAHLAGYAGEAEANFIAWLVCLQGPPGAEYSGNLALLTYLVDALPAPDRDAVVRAIGPGPRRDLQAVQRRAAQAWPWLEQPAWWVYDRYLRANRVEQGVHNYGAAVELIVGTRFHEGWVPGRRRGTDDRRRKTDDRR